MNEKLNISKSNEKVIPFKNRKLFDLEYCDGPLCGVFEADQNSVEIYNWDDSDNMMNYWVRFKVQNELLVSYIKKAISFKTLVEKSIEGIVEIVGYDDSLTPSPISSPKIEELLSGRPEYEICLFDENLTEDNKKINRWAERNGAWEVHSVAVSGTAKAIKIDPIDTSNPASFGPLLEVA